MKPERAFIAERALAQHCPELLKAAPDPAELMPLLGRVGERLARRLAGSLAPLLGGEAPLVRCDEVRDGTAASLREGAKHRLAANCLFAVGAGAVATAAPLLVSLNAEAVFRIVDRAFGGKGAAPRPLPEAFPMAAEMMIARLEILIAAQITAAVDAVAESHAAMAGARDITPQRRDGSLGNLAPFAEGQRLAILPISVEDNDIPPWDITLALPIAALPGLLGMASAKVPAGARQRSPNGAMNEPFGDLPLTLSALIVDMALPFATVAGLAPGQILPVNVARRVPLRIGEHTIAHGTVGALDECAAIQITSVFSEN
jgi:flagellar motor switch protein FliM